jgi:hypothetical protein
MVTPIPKKPGHTGKRETAWALIAMLIIAGIYAMTGSDPAMVEARVRMVEVLAWPIITFAAFAYGAEWVSRQTNWGGPQTPEDPYTGKVD